MVPFRAYEISFLFLLLVKFHGSGGVDVLFIQEPSNPSYFNDGSDAKLVWDYVDPHNNIQNIIYSVLVNGTFVRMMVDGSHGVQEHLAIPPSYKGRVKIEGRATLVIKNINPGDNTKFKCELIGSFLYLVQSTVQLIVAEAPLIYLSLGGRYFIEGSPVTVACTASGKPPPDVAWIRNGVLGSSGKKATFLKFDNINRKDAGQYTCRANNSVEVTSIDTKIVVYYKPEGARLTTNASQNTVTEGDTVTFKCKVMAAVPQVSIYKFYFNGGILSGNSNSEYTLTNVNRSQHYGDYQCVPHNDAGDGAGATMRLNINVPVQFTEVPQNITVNTSTPLFLNCDATGFPEPKIRWEKSGIHFCGTKQLKISSINTNDAGEYICIASNGVRQEKTVRAYVTVQYPPTIQNVTASSKKSWIGQTVTLKCLSDGVPTPTLSWYKPEGSEINRVRARENKVQVPLGGDQDFGHYKCIAANGLIPSDEKLIEINHIRAPDVVEIDELPSETTDNKITLKWKEPKSNGKVITMYTVYLRVITDGKVGQWTEIRKIRDVSVRELKIALERGKVYQFAVTATNELGESLKQEKANIQQVKAEGSPEECNCPSNNVLLAIIGVLVFTILLLIIYIIWLHKKGAVGKQRTNEDERGVYDNETGLEDIEPSVPVSRKLTQPPAEYMDLMEVNKDNRKAQRTAPGADYMPLHPLTRCWEVPRHHVTIEKIIGKGAFGQVAKGTAVGLRGSPETTTVAIKMLKRNATESDKRDLMKELDTMKQLEPHPYVIKLLGCVTESEELLVLIEYVPCGDLLGYLRKSRGLKDTYYKDSDIKPQTNLTSQQLMRFAWQIADGMSYLTSKSIIHRDLAARNILVGKKETCKVTNFGMARDVQQENIYERKTKGRIPVKWTAYEALLYGKYTTKSDVWSYGVLLYEIFTIGGTPYPRMDGRKVADLLQDGYRMPKPQHVDENLYEIMMKCWKNDPHVRPTFTELKNQLKDMETLHK